MAYPIANSPMFPSTADAPFLPPKLEEMPVANEGLRYYRCEDGITRLMTQEQAERLGISCEALVPGVFGGWLAGARYKGVTLGDRRVVRRI